MGNSDPHEPEMIDIAGPILPGDYEVYREIGQSKTGWFNWFKRSQKRSVAEREIAEIFKRIDRELPLAEARVDRLLKQYRS